VASSNIHTKFHENQSPGSEVEKEDTHTDRLHGYLISLLSFRTKGK
jgi:hypothetical protein